LSTELLIAANIIFIVIMSGILFLFKGPWILLQIIRIFAYRHKLSEKDTIAVSAVNNVKWFDDYYTIEFIDEQTVAIGENRYCE